MRKLVCDRCEGDLPQKDRYAVKIIAQQQPWKKGSPTFSKTLPKDYCKVCACDMISIIADKIK
jgi:hypothetical protein